ncbi:hypothetical protein MHBO_001881 [Bonamia ostreae]|uniref:Uncharacterized protein n=1 Tax=Bonamia ostreae TaxID=126728 RepID=A0ABV2ALA6_9EUKA
MNDIIPVNSSQIKMYFFVNRVSRKIECRLIKSSVEKLPALKNVYSEDENSKNNILDYMKDKYNYDIGINENLFNSEAYDLYLQNNFSSE